MVEGRINYNGLTVDYNKFVAKDKNILRKLFKSLTIKEKPIQGRPKNIPIKYKYGYIINNNEIIFPIIYINTFLQCKLIDSFIDLRTVFPRTINKYSISIPLYDYQQQLLDYLISEYYNKDAIHNHKSICYLQMDTGLGKTRIGCALSNELQVPTLIVVPTIAIGHQWISEYKKMFMDIKIEFYHNNNNYSSLKYDVLIIVVNTLSKKNPSFVANFGLIIFDEAHEYCSLWSSKILWMYTNSILGLSATPNDRPDGLDKYILLHLGEPIYAKDIIDIDNIVFKGQVKCINYYGSKEYTESVLTASNTVSTVLTVLNIIKDTKRVDLICTEIKQLVDDNYGVFVFSEFRNFLDVIKEHLINIIDPDLISIEDEDISILRGGIHESVLIEAKKRGAHVVLTTYGYSKRGISLTEMTAMVLVTPRRNGLTQIIGRILRRGSDETIVRKIIDIVDANSFLRHQYKERKQIYNKKKYPIDIININNNTEIIVNEDLEIDNIEIDNLQNILYEIYN
jgi:superfamily II DNA or RNA helicase